MTEFNNLWLKKIAVYHDKWISIVKGIGGDMYAEDIVQEMYIKIFKLVDKRGTYDFLFKNGKLQDGYIFFTLRSILYAYLIQKNKHRKSPIEWLIKNLDKDKQNNPVTFGELTDENYIYDEQDSSSKMEAEERFLKKIDLESLNWSEYDRDIFNIYKDTGMSFREMSKYTKISYTHLFYRVKDCKEKLKDSLQEDWEDLDNEDYELI